MTRVLTVPIHSSKKALHNSDKCGFHRQILKIFLSSKICSLVIQSNIYRVTDIEGLCRYKEGSLSVNFKIGIIYVGPVIT